VRRSSTASTTRRAVLLVVVLAVVTGAFLTPGPAGAVVTRHGNGHRTSQCRAGDARPPVELRFRRTAPR
jgi:hypothetical protein